MLLYDLGILIYSGLVRAVSGRNKAAKQMYEGRKNLFVRLATTIDPKSEIAWFHAASLGEFEQGRPLMEAYKASHPNHKILLTFFSPSGYEIRKNYEGADYIFYLPYDTRYNAQKFIKLINPKVVFFIKYEFWLNFLAEIRRNQIPCYLVSAIFNPQQLFFKRYGGFYRNALKAFTRLFVQDEASKTLLATIGYSNCTVAGDTRFDRVAQITESAKELPILEHFKGESRLFIGGSTWEADDKIICDLIRIREKNCKFVIAPHQITEQKITGLCETLSKEGFVTECYTTTTPEKVKNADVLIINCIGILSSVYRYGYAGMIGGGFGVGIHNTLEAATFGLPLLFGPNYKRFREACDLIECGAAQPITTSEEAIAWFKQINASPTSLEQKQSAAANYVKSHTGAVKQILSEI